MSILIVTDNSVPEDREVKEVLKISRGNSIVSKGFSKKLRENFNNILGSDLNEYEQLFSTARAEALSEMERNAKSVNADAVIGVKIDTTQITRGTVECTAYGTAVKLSEL